MPPTMTSVHDPRTDRGRLLDHRRDPAGAAQRLQRPPPHPQARALERGRPELHRRRTRCSTRRSRLVRGYADAVAERIAALGGVPPRARRRDPRGPHLGRLRPRPRHGARPPRRPRPRLHRRRRATLREAIETAGEIDPVTEDLLIGQAAEPRAVPVVRPGPPRERGRTPGPPRAPRPRTRPPTAPATSEAPLLVITGKSGGPLSFGGRRFQFLSALTPGAAAGRGSSRGYPHR